MGNKQALPQISPQLLQQLAPKLTPQQVQAAACNTKKREFTDASKRAEEAQKAAREKQLAADKCSPLEAAARAAVASGPTKCQVNDVKLRESQRDVQTLTAEWENCNKDEVLRRKLDAARKEADAWEAGARAQMNAANSDYASKIDAVEKITASAKELYKTLYEKEKELAQLQSHRENTEQLERRERRAFLDNDPQGGTGGAPGIRTEDDRVLFPFWVIFSFFVGVLIILVLFLTVRHWLYGYKFLTVVFGTPVALAVAYYFIAFYG